MVKHTQRLYDLVDLSVLDDDLRERVIEAEESIYAAADDPLVNWETRDLRAALAQAGLVELAIKEESQEAEMLVSPATLERWFSEETEQERPSYAQHLLACITADEIAGLKALFFRRLAGEAVVWRTRIAFVVGQSPGNPPQAPD